MRIFLVIIIPVFSGMFICCSPSLPPSQEAAFSKADSLTEQYLSFQDSLHKVWNVMISSDNQKIEGMKNLLHELMVTNAEKAEELSSLESRLNQLVRIRYTQKSLSNADVITEYDQATQSLTTELLGTAHATREFSYNRTLQQLVSKIETSSQQVFVLRHQYDSLVKVYNRFVDVNRASLLESDESLSVEKKPLFHMVSDHQ